MVHKILLKHQLTINSNITVSTKSQTFVQKRTYAYFQARRYTVCVEK